MDSKRINVKTMETLTHEEYDKLAKALEKLDGFRFFIHAQVSIE